MLNQIPQINLRKDVMKICTSKNQKKHNYIIHWLSIKYSIYTDHLYPSIIFDQ